MTIKCSFKKKFTTGELCSLNQIECDEEQCWIYQIHQMLKKILESE